MNLEIRAKRGPILDNKGQPLISRLECYEPGSLIVHVQMGTTFESLAEPLRHFVQPEVVNGVINLWANEADHREFEVPDDSRDLIIRRPDKIQRSNQPMSLGEDATVSKRGLKLEIHTSRGPILDKNGQAIITRLETDKPGSLRVHVQMGAPSQYLAEPLRHFLQPETVNHVINLWANPDHCREFEEDDDGRTLIIRDCA